VPPAKILHFARRANHLYKPALSALAKRAYRDRHETLGADAMAGVCVIDDALNLGRRSRVVLMPRRWHQLATMLCIAPGRWQTSPVTGESTI